MFSKEPGDQPRGGLPHGQGLSQARSQRPGCLGPRRGLPGLGTEVGRLAAGGPLAKCPQGGAPRCCRRGEAKGAGPTGGWLFLQSVKCCGSGMGEGLCAPGHKSGPPTPPLRNLREQRPYPVPPAAPAAPGSPAPSPQRGARPTAPPTPGEVPEAQRRPHPKPRSGCSRRPSRQGEPTRGGRADAVGGGGAAVAPPPPRPARAPPSPGSVPDRLAGRRTLTPRGRGGPRGSARRERPRRRTPSGLRGLPARPAPGHGGRQARRPRAAAGAAHRGGDPAARE